MPVEPSREEQFENLATLAVETKLQVRELESRVARLEQVLTGEL
jgi:BMFP domain-containing protein YqiC